MRKRLAEKQSWWDHKISKKRDLTCVHFALYATAGAGYGRYDIDAGIVNPTDGMGYINHSEDVFAYKGGAGATYNINEQMAVDLGYEYLGTSHATINGAEVNKIGSHNIVTSFRFMF